MDRQQKSGCHKGLKEPQCEVEGVMASDVYTVTPWLTGTAEMWNGVAVVGTIVGPPAGYIPAEPTNGGVERGYTSCMAGPAIADMPFEVCGPGPELVPSAAAAAAGMGAPQAAACIGGYPLRAKRCAGKCTTSFNKGTYAGANLAALVRYCLSSRMASGCLPVRVNTEQIAYDNNASSGEKILVANKWRVLVQAEVASSTAVEVCWLMQSCWAWAAWTNAMTGMGHVPRGDTLASSP